MIWGIPDIVSSWVREDAADKKQAFPGRGQMKTDDAEVRQLKRVAANESRAGHCKQRHLLLHDGADRKFGFIANHPDVWPIRWLCELKSQAKRSGKSRT